MTKLLMLPGIIMALSFHEFAHAWVSDKLGDPTPRRQGRVTLNPLAHIDWIGFITLIIVGFGWGKPVQIDPGYYKNRRRDEFLVAIAGVTMNLILAIIISFPVKMMMKTNVFGASALGYDIYMILFYAVMINLVLMIFNLIPCPPLDGWNIITQIFKGGILDPPGDLKLRQQILPGDVPVLLPIENMVGNLKITEEEKQGKVKIMICGQIQTILMIDLL